MADALVVDPSDVSEISVDPSDVSPVKSLSMTEKARNLLMTGKTSGPGHYDLPTEKDQFNFPPWLQAVNTAAALGSGAKALGDLAEAGPQIPGMVKNAAAFAKAYAAPKATGRIAKGMAAVQDRLANEAAQGVPDALRTSAADTPLAGGVKKQALKFTPGRTTQGVAKAPIRMRGPQGSNPDLVEAAPDTTNPDAALPDTPVPAPGRVRATPEAQTRADEIAALNRHADTLPLAQQTIQQGVSAKTLLALPDDARKAYMAKLGLANRSDATWRTYIGHVLRLEKLQK